MSRRWLFLAAALGVFAASASAASLWEDRASLFTTRKRFQSGDIVTIVVEEATSAEGRWRQERSNEIEVEGTAAPLGNGAGDHNLFGRFLPFMELEYEAESQRDNRSNRATTVRSRIAAEVVNILPNGNLQVVGRKNVRVNSEDQLLEVRGNLRPEDVNEANEASSNALADARILLNGRIRFTTDEKPNVLEWFFGFLSGLFF